MIFLPLKRYAVTLLLLASGLAQATTLAQLQQEAQSNPRLQAILAVNAQAPMSTLTSATNQLQTLYRQYPDYRVAKMFYGYGQLFMATDFLAKKNYLRAAETSKLGFSTLMKRQKPRKTTGRCVFCGPGWMHLCPRPMAVASSR
ncbi:hypothetical protein ACQ86O_19180 [Serratia sp. L9]|uniref:hypothetical protein n=1 Tax=Serratia sp. L9 TaxID=3423946 RepID=UPI003D66B8E0